MNSRAYLVEECRDCAEVETKFRSWSEFLAAQVSENQSVSVERDQPDLQRIIIIIDVFGFIQPYKKDVK